MKTLRKFLFTLVLVVGLAACKTQNPTVQNQAETVSVDHPQSVDIRGEKIHYIERGEGEPLIFVHGTIGDYRAWASRMEPYSKDYHVVAYSRRYAYPNAQKFVSLVDYSVRIHADDLYALIQQLGLEKARIIGHSYGAYTALTMALDHPEVVESLVRGEPPAPSLLENSEAGKQSFNSFLENYRRPGANAFKSGKNEEGIELFLQGVMGNGINLNDVPLQRKQAWMDNLSELWGFAITDSFLTLDTPDIKKLDVPVLLFTGDSSPLWFIEISKELNRLLPNSQLVVLENSSHGLMFQNPTDFDAEVLPFLAKH